MTIDSLSSPGTAHSRRRWFLIAALVMGLLIAPEFCLAQSTQASNQERERVEKSASERDELLQIIKNLQERVAKLESQVSDASPSKSPDAKPKATATASGASSTPVTTKASASEPGQAGEEKDSQETGIYHEWGTYIHNRGFKVVSTEHGDLNLSIYTYARYLNQRALNSTYEDAFGNTKSVQQRQDFQLQKVQIKFLGWVMNPKFRYFLYTWTSNANQGRGAQVVVAGNLGYTFSKYFMLATGITSLPGTRSVEGNFPFWLGVDSRLIADEFFRPSYTTGVFARGEITNKLKYQIMLGNNMSILGVSAAQLDKRFNHDLRKVI